MTNNDACKGKNCNATDGIHHSPDCIAEHALTTGGFTSGKAIGYLVIHVDFVDNPKLWRVVELQFFDSYKDNENYFVYPLCLAASPQSTPDLIYDTSVVKRIAMQTGWAQLTDEQIDVVLSNLEILAAQKSQSWSSARAHLHNLLALQAAPTGDQHD